MRALFATPAGFIIVGGVILLLGLAFYFLVLSESAKNRRKMRERMKSLGDRNKKTKASDAASAAGTSLRRDQAGTAMDQLARRLLPNPKILRDRLEATGQPIGIGKYFGISIVVGIVCGAAFWFYSGMPAAAAPLVGLAGGVLLPHKFISRKIAKRQAEFLNQLGEGMDLIVRGVKSGLPVAETVNTVSEEMPNPIGGEFRRVMEDTRVGMTLEAAFWESAQRMGVAEYKFFVVTLTVQRETGGNLAETLEGLAELVRNRKQMKLKVKAMSSEARASMYILGGLPFGIGGILSLVAPQYIGTLFVTEPGHYVLGVGGVLLGMGWLVMNKMVAFEI